MFVSPLPLRCPAVLGVQGAMVWFAASGLVARWCERPDREAAPQTPGKKTASQLRADSERESAILSSGTTGVLKWACHGNLFEHRWLKQLWWSRRFGGDRGTGGRSRLQFRGWVASYTEVAAFLFVLAAGQHREQWPADVGGALQDGARAVRVSSRVVSFA